jgi:hypothetical protein
VKAMNHVKSSNSSLKCNIKQPLEGTINIKRLLFTSINTCESVCEKAYGNNLKI